MYIDIFNNDSLKILRWERLCVFFSVGDNDWEYLFVDCWIIFFIYIFIMIEWLFCMIGKNDLCFLIVVVNFSNSSKYGLVDFDVYKIVESV